MTDETETEARQYARNAAERVDRAAARSGEQKLLDVRTALFLEAIARGEQVVIPAEQYAELQRLRAGSDDDSN